MNNMIFVLSIVVNVMLTMIVLFFFYRLHRIEKKYSEFISKFDKNENIHAWRR